MIRNPSVAALAALFMGALGQRRAGECFCGHCLDGEKPSLADATALALKTAYAERTALDQSIKLLENPTRDGKQLVELHSCIMMYKGEPIFINFSAYGTEEEGDQDFTLVVKDSRKEEEKAFNVHGIGAVQATIESITQQLKDELLAKMEADAAAAQPGTSEGQPS